MDVRSIRMGTEGWRRNFQMQGMAPGKVLGNKECSRHLDTVCGWVCRTAMEECEMKLLESTIQGFVDVVEAFGFYPKSTRDGAGVGEGGDLMIFILKSPLWLLLEDGCEGECGQLGGYCRADVEMERSG